MNTQHVFPCIKHMERRAVRHWAKGVTAPIVGCSKTERVDDAIEALGVQLSESDIACMATATGPGCRFQ